MVDLRPEYLAQLHQAHDSTRQMIAHLQAALAHPCHEEVVGDHLRTALDIYDNSDIPLLITTPTPIPEDLASLTLDDLPAVRELEVIYTAMRRDVTLLFILLDQMQAQLTQAAAECESSNEEC
jgi:hypothetical protein